MHSNMKQRILTWSAACSLALLATATSAQGFKQANDKGAGGMRLKETAGASAPASSRSTQLTPRSADFIVAVVNSEPITNVEVQQQYDRMVAQADSSNALSPSAMRRQALEMLIAQKIQLQMAAERNISVDSFAIQQAEENVARQNSLTMPQLQERLQREGIAPAQFRADLKKQLTIQKLREVEVDAKVKVNDLEVDQYLSLIHI